MAQDWRRLSHRIDVVLRCLRWGSFIVLDYDRARHGDDCPYVQAAPGPAGWYAEVASSRYLDPGVAVPDQGWLVGAGWRPPDADTHNWWRAGVPADEVLTALFDGLRHGLGCRDANRVDHTIGRFPHGPRGGEPKPSETEDGRISIAAA